MQHTNRLSSHTFLVHHIPSFTITYLPCPLHTFLVHHIPSFSITYLPFPSHTFLSHHIPSLSITHLPFPNPPGWTLNPSSPTTVSSEWVPQWCLPSSCRSSLACSQTHLPPRPRYAGNCAYYCSPPSQQNIGPASDCRSGLAAMCARTLLSLAVTSLTPPLRHSQKIRRLV